MEVRVMRVEATMYIQGFTEMLPRKAPTAAITMLTAISLLAPNLSDRSPVGTVKNICMRDGMATRRPTCWYDRLNSSWRIGKRTERMFPAAWTSRCVTTMMMRLWLSSFVLSFALFSPISDHLMWSILLHVKLFGFVGPTP